MAENIATPAPRPEAASRGNRVLVAYHIGEANWLTDADWRGALFSSRAPDWFALEKDRRAVCIKRGHLRSTWRVSLDGTTIYAKVFAGGGLFSQLRTWLLGSPAHREWRPARQAEARGVPIVSFLAVGARRGYEPKTALLSEGLPATAPLAVVWERDVTPFHHAARRRRAVRVTDAVARLLAVSHDRGFVHRDGHPSNVVIHSRANNDDGAAFVDVRAAKLTRGPVPERLAIRSFAQLDQYFQLRATRAERHRAIRSYLRFRAAQRGEPLHRGAARRFSRAVLEESRVQALRLARRRDRRLVWGSGYFATLALAQGWSARACLKLARRHLFPEADVPDRSVPDWRNLVGNEFPLNPPAVDAPEAAAHEIEVGPTAWEFVYARSLWDRLTWTVFGSPPRRAFDQTHRLRHRDFPVPLVLGYVEHRRRGVIDVAALIRPRRNR